MSTQNGSPFMRWKYRLDVHDVNQEGDVEIVCYSNNRQYLEDLAAYYGYEDDAVKVNK